MRARILLLVVAVAFGTPAYAASLVNEPLKWRPTSDLRLGTIEMSQAPVQFDVFTDARDRQAGNR